MVDGSVGSLSSSTFLPRCLLSAPIFIAFVFFFLVAERLMAVTLSAPKAWAKLGCPVLIFRSKNRSLDLGT